MSGSERGNDVLRLAMELLARREHSKKELTVKLSARGAERAAIAPVLESLEHDGLQSDERYAQALLQSHVRRGKGPLRIRAELRARGVGDDLIEAALREGETSWTDHARRARAKRFGEALPQTREERARQARFLEQRGFAAEHIRAALEL